MSESEAALGGGIFGITQMIECAVDDIDRVAEWIHSPRASCSYSQVLEDSELSKEWDFALDKVARASVWCTYFKDTFNIMDLNRTMLRLWPSQPLYNLGDSYPCLEGAWHYMATSVRIASRIIGHNVYPLDESFGKALDENLPRFVERATDVRRIVHPTKDEHFETVLWRLHDLYESVVGTSVESYLRSRGESEPKGFGLTGFDDAQVKRVTRALEQHGADAKADVIYRACRPIRRSTCLDIRRLLIETPVGNHGT